MNTYGNNAHINALSDIDLDAVSGGGRGVLTKEEREVLDEMKKIAAKDGGKSQAIDLDAWKAAMKDAK